MFEAFFYPKHSFHLGSLNLIVVGGILQIAENKTNWKAIALFYFIACLWSWPFFWWRDIYPESWKALQIPNFLKSWLIMWGPGISAIICFFLFKKHQRKINFQGTSFWFGISFFFILPIVLTILHGKFHYLLFGILGFVSILGEELGWRGFLQDALKIDSDFKKSILIGSMWEIWHFTNRTAHSNFIPAFIRVSLWAIVLGLLSYVMIKLTKNTKSIFIPVTVHYAFNAAFEFQLGWQSVLISLPFWGLIFWKWNKRIGIEYD